MSIMQDFNYGVSGKYVFYPALKILPSGNLVMAYEFSSRLTILVSLLPNRLPRIPWIHLSPTLMQQGSDYITLTYGCSSGVCRYRDYGAGLDPSVSNGFWVAGEYGSGVLDSSGYGPSWGTQIGNFTG